VEQLAFELAQPEPPSFANFAIGRNAEPVDVVVKLAQGARPAAAIVLWGAFGSGRSHLLHAAVAAASAAGRPALYCAGPSAAPAEPPDVGALVAVDDCGGADAAAQGHLFTLYNRLAETGGGLLVAADAPPARLALRNDLRSRLGAGLVYEVIPLADGDKPAALVTYARSRGIDLPDDVIAYLLSHGRRDMPSLMATLDALDRESLVTKRPITIPLLRGWMQRALQPPNGPHGP